MVASFSSVLFSDSFFFVVVVVVVVVVCLFFFYLTKTLSVESARLYFSHRLSSIGDDIFKALVKKFKRRRRKKKASNCW